MAAKLAKIAVCTIVYLAAFDIAGVVASFVFEVAGVVMRGVSGALFYALWFVLGVFCGLLNYNTAGGLASPKSEADWTSRADATQTGLLVCAISTLLLIGLSVFFFSIFWDRRAEGDHYVPDSMPLTLTFFIAAGAATFVAHNFLRPAPKQV
jgi:heme/copper-type cytochrome/quinol oxidase subunit 1